MNTGTRRRELQEVDERTTQENILVCDCIGMLPGRYLCLRVRECDRLRVRYLQGSMDKHDSNG